MKWLITTIKSWFKKEPEKPKQPVYGKDYLFQEPPKILKEPSEEYLYAQAKIRAHEKQSQYEKNKADQAKIKYKPEHKTQPGSLPIRDIYEKYRHDVPRNPHWIVPDLTLIKQELVVVEYLNYTEENDDDRLRKEADANTFMGSSQDSPN